MKAVFFSLFAIATSALAAPASEADTRLPAREVNDIHERSVEAEEFANLNSRSVSTSAEMIHDLKTCNNDITNQCDEVGMSCANKPSNDTPNTS